MKCLDFKSDIKIVPDKLLPNSPEKTMFLEIAVEFETKTKDLDL